VTKADQRRILHELETWLLFRKRKLDWRTYDEECAKLDAILSAHALEIVIHALRANASGCYPGIKAAEQRACGKLAARLMSEGLPADLELPTCSVKAEPLPEPTPVAEPPAKLDRSDLYARQAAHGIMQDATDGRVCVHHASSPIGDTDTLWGDYEHLVSWRTIGRAAGGWKTGEIAAHFPAPPGAVDLRGLPSRHGMLRDDALGPLVRALRGGVKVGVHLVTDCHAGILACDLPGWVHWV
jgi:hypothetical protein